MIFNQHIIDIKTFLCNYYTGLSMHDIQIQETRKEFEGDYTIIMFSMIKFSKKNISDTAHEIGTYLTNNIDYISSFNSVSGFLNLKFSDSFWFDVFRFSFLEEFEINDSKNKIIVIESCSPNTNKPLHLGHLRNIVLGHAVANILDADGYKVKRVQIINDRGIHICKSMLAWLKFGNGESPEKSNIKGDHLVGKYYVLFEKKYQLEQESLIENGFSSEEAKANSTLLNDAKKMLRKWENGDSEILDLWEKMNSWVYQGFEVTYNKIGVSFDKIYYESDTYLIGKESILSGVDNSIFHVKDDQSVWIDLKDNDLDEKLLIRSDGTTVYMTQDIGTAITRYNELHFDKMIYVVGNEQNHHFKVLFSILKKMNFAWSNNLLHLSYGMVNLPDGKMKSREGNVIDIDDLLDEMYVKAKKIIIDSNKSNMVHIDSLAKTIGEAALKYFILKPDPKKEVLFNPEDSIDFNGHTGPFIQYTYARIQSILCKKNKLERVCEVDRPLLKEEKQLIRLILNYPLMLEQSSVNLNPSILANYLYSLSKDYNHFYQKIPILNVGNVNDVNFRVTISKKVGILIYKGMRLLGIDVPITM